MDADFCLRLRQSGLKILSVPAVLIEHELGEKQTRNLLGFKFSFRIHTAWRYYYNIRNRLILHRRFLAFDPGWVFNDARWLILELGRICLLEHGRGPNFARYFMALETDCAAGLVGTPISRQKVNESTAAFLVRLDQHSFTNLSLIFHSAILASWLMKGPRF